MAEGELLLSLIMTGSGVVSVSGAGVAATGDADERAKARC
jgi:hypothetical protein